MGVTLVKFISCLCAEGPGFNLILRYPVVRVRQGSCNFCFSAAGIGKVKSEKYENLARLLLRRPLFVGGELVCEFALCADPLRGLLARTRKLVCLCSLIECGPITAGEGIVCIISARGPTGPRDPRRRNNPFTPESHSASSNSSRAFQNHFPRLLPPSKAAAN
jgi:hypothetical protein